MNKIMVYRMIYVEKRSSWKLYVTLWTPVIRCLNRYKPKKRSKKLYCYPNIPFLKSRELAKGDRVRGV